MRSVLSTLLSLGTLLPVVRAESPCSPPIAVPKTGAVASESSVCSKIGIDLLASGGNAVDAVVGTIFCVGVIGMYHSGIGGGGFMLLRDKHGEYEFIDFRETAPAAAFENMFKDNEALSLTGGLARYVYNKVKKEARANRGAVVFPASCVPPNTSTRSMAVFHGRQFLHLQ